MWLRRSLAEGFLTPVSVGWCWLLATTLAGIVTRAVHVAWASSRQGGWVLRASVSRKSQEETLFPFMTLSHTGSLLLHCIGPGSHQDPPGFKERGYTLFLMGQWWVTWSEEHVDFVMTHIWKLLNTSCPTTKLLHISEPQFSRL